MVKKKRTRTIPSIVGLLILSSLVLGGVYLTQRLKTDQQVSASAQPVSVRVTNISSQSVTIYWLTEEPAQGSVKINNQVYLDDRDKKSNQPQNYLTHYVTLDNLKPEKNYQFTIISQGQDHQEDSFQFTTARSLAGSTKEADLAFGLVLDQEGQPLSGALVTLSLTGATNLASLTDQAGFWSIPLSTAYQKNLTNLVDYDQEKQILEIFVEAKIGAAATAITNTGNDHPVPPITIGQTYDYSKNPPSPKQHPQDFDWSSPEIKKEINNHFPQEKPAEAETITQGKEDSPLDIDNPQEGETVLTTRPKFSGQGPANQKIKIILESPKKFEEELSVSSFGSWQWTPPESIAPGRHTITVEYYDENNLLQTISRTFTVQAASASPSPTPITPLPTSPKNTPTPTPKQPITTTPLPSPTTTITSPPSPTGQEDAGPEKIVSGSLTPLVILAILGLGLIFFAANIYQNKWQ